MSSIPKQNKKPLYTRWWVWVIIVFAVLVVVGGIAVSRTLTQSQIDKYRYLEDSVDVRKRTLKKTVSASGEVTPNQSTLFTASAPARVSEVNVSAGDAVSSGDVLVKTEGEEFTAPYDGRVLAVHTFVDDRIGVAQMIVEVGSSASHIAFYASDAEAVEIEKGQTATLTVPAENNGSEEYEAEVEFRSPKKYESLSTAGAESGYEIRISTGDIPEDLAALVGLAVDVDITIEERSNVLSVSRGAVQEDDNGDAFVYLPATVDAVFAADARGVDDIAMLLGTEDITTGFEGDEYVEITDGLNDGDRVLLFVTEPTGGTAL